MLLDIDWLYNALILDTSQTSLNKNIKSINNIVRAGRAAKIGSRAIKILRIIRLIRQIRMIKLYKEGEKVFDRHFKKKLEDKAKKNADIPSESIVGRKLSELTSRKLVILVFVVIMGLIFLDITFYFEKQNTMDYGITIFKYFNKSNPELKMTFDIYISEHTNTTNNVIFAQIGELSYGDVNKTLSMRDTDKITSVDDCPSLSDNEEFQTVFIF